MDPVVAAIRKELEEKADPAIRESSKRFFKEEISCYDEDRGCHRNCEEIPERGPVT